LNIRIGVGVVTRSFPFTNYDFFAYIASGFVFLFALDHVLGTGWMIRPSWTVVEGVFATACAYAVGHLIAGIASALLERRLVRRWLGPPNLHLFGAGNPSAWVKRIYPVYFEPFPPETQARIRDKAAKEGVTQPGEAMYRLSFNTARENKAASRRMADFLNLYGLCRNLSFTALVSAVMLVIGAIYWRHRSDLWWAAAGVVLSVGMLFRYLKFYRHYALEVFTCYAFAKPKIKNAAT
jgi:hypothetical protein